LGVSRRKRKTPDPIPLNPFHGRTGSRDLPHPVAGRTRVSCGVTRQAGGGM